jgi:hypothetical protein
MSFVQVSNIDEIPIGEMEHFEIGEKQEVL